jgi:hypothetical protein
MHSNPFSTPAKHIKCPKCGHVRHAGDPGSGTQCPACGIFYAKFSADGLPSEVVNRRVARAQETDRKTKPLRIVMMVLFTIAWLGIYLTKIGPFVFQGHFTGPGVLAAGIGLLIGPLVFVGKFLGFGGDD